MTRLALRLAASLTLCLPLACGSEAPADPDAATPEDAGASDAGMPRRDAAVPDEDGGAAFAGCEGTGACADLDPTVCDAMGVALGCTPARPGRCEARVDCPALSETACLDASALCLWNGAACAWKSDSDRNAQLYMCPVLEDVGMCEGHGCAWVDAPQPCGGTYDCARASASSADACASLASSGFACAAVAE